MLIEFQCKFSDFLERILRIKEVLPYFPHKNLLFKHLLQMLFKEKRLADLQSIDLWRVINLKYFISKGYIKISREKVIFNYRGIQACMPLKWVYELVSMLDVLEKMSKIGCYINSSNGRHFIIDFSKIGVNVKMILPFPYSPHAIYWTFVKKVFHEDVKEGIVIDVGAYIGDTAIWFAKRGATVYAFEPFPVSFNYAKMNCNINHVEDCVKLYPIAISSYSGKMKIKFNPDFYKVEGFGPYLNGLSEIYIECWSLKDVLEKLKLDHVDLLKMDCEGCEFDVISSSIDVLPRFRKIVLEYHVKEDAEREHYLKYLLKPLKVCGFRYTVKGNHIYATRKI